MYVSNQRYEKGVAMVKFWSELGDFEKWFCRIFLVAVLLGVPSRGTGPS